ncbi:MAG: hypothetical protein ABIU77_12920 [Ferruginibacter sp.]
MSVFRIQAMLEKSIALQCEIAAYLSKKDFKEISEATWKDINADTQSLIDTFSNQGSSPENN